ncbi:MAG: AAA family ATPase [Candidatus Saccharimonadales bacterium]|jgi:predicted kinase
MDDQPILILVNGLPGTGKSTLAAKLSRDLRIPCMGKDMLKEFFFDTLAIESRAQSRMIGSAVIEMLYTLAETYLTHQQPLIEECPFFVEYGRPKFKAIISEHPALVIEIYCHTDKDERRKRVFDRNEGGNRHQGHIEAMNYLNLDDPEPYEEYAPLEVGELIRVDTTHFADTEYERLLTDIRSRIKQGTIEHSSANG